MSNNMQRLLKPLLIAAALAVFLPLTMSALAMPLALPEDESVFPPLPRSCASGLSPGASIPVSCLFGYVYLNGKAIFGAKVTVISEQGRAEVQTREGPDSSQPYFHLSLSDKPLVLIPGNSVTIVAEYNNDRRTLSHIVLSGAQQINLVLPNQAQIGVSKQFTRPIATLVAMSSRSIIQGEAIILHGIAFDSDDYPQTPVLEWFLDGASTPFASGSTISLSTSDLIPGRHRVALRARDSVGETSDLEIASFDVITPATQARSGTHWTFLLYLGADAPNLAPYLNRTSPLGALYRLEHAVANANVTVVALYDGPLPDGGDTFYYIIRPDGSVTQEAVGEFNMGDAQTLVDFINRGRAAAPADAIYLALAGHATALDGIVWDTTSGRDERLTPAELRLALVTATDAGARPIDILHFEGSLMGLIEPAYQVQGLARYLVASESLGWSSFPFDQYRSLVSPQTAPRELAIAIADRYAVPLRDNGYPFTISVLDLAQIDELVQATSILADALLPYALANASNRQQLNQLREQAQKLDSDGNYILTSSDEYVDLDHWAELVQNGITNSSIQVAAAQVRQAFQLTVLANYRMSGSLAQTIGVQNASYNFEYARGLGIYYPARPSTRTYSAYVQGDLRFVIDAKWDEYLAVGLVSLPFDPVEPDLHLSAPLLLPTSTLPTPPVLPPSIPDWILEALAAFSQAFWRFDRVQ